jgi:SMC interacting uncharacterized protein involved in chromosome segregation
MEMIGAWFPQTDIEFAMQDEIDTLRAEVEHWKAIAQAHNDSLVARIEENKKLTERLNNRPDWKHSLDLQAENERLRAENGLLMAENRTESERLKEACDGYLAHAAGLRDENAKLLERIRFADQEFAAECAALRGENERLKDCNVELETRRNDAERERHTLRAENERLTRCCNGDVERERNELRAENERLREALEKIAVHHWCEIEIEEIAHAALTAIHVEESAPSAGSATYNERWKSKP